jgi:DnaK suppressor protein
MSRRTEILYFEAPAEIRDWLLGASAAKLCTIDEILCDLCKKEMAAGPLTQAEPTKATSDGSLRTVGEDLTAGKGPTQVFRRLRKASPPPPKRPRKKSKKAGAAKVKAVKTAAPKKAAKNAPVKKAPAKKAPVKKAVKPVAKKKAATK